MKKVLFIKNAAILTGTALALRFFGIVFKVWLAKQIGSEGVGLSQLILSVYVLASAFASSGISTAVTRLTAEDLALGKSPLPVLRRAVFLSLVLAFFSVAVLLCFAEPIALSLLGDARAVPALKILPLSLPFMGLTSCLRGYFLARRHIAPNALSQLFEQLVRMGTVFLLLSRFAAGGLAVCCRVVMLGDVAAETGAFLLILLFWHFDKRHLPDGALPARTDGTTGKILHIALPITSGRYLNTALRTGESILVPKKLTEYSADSAAALSQFGMIKGMALPVLFFPETLLTAVSTLLIPEISEAAAKGQRGVVRSATARIFKLTCVMSFLFGAVFFVQGDEIALLLYGETEVGFLLRALSPLVPFMYLESVSDGILKGLDQQGFTFRTAVSDSLLRIGLVAAILPSFGLRGFLFIMYLSNLMTCGLNVGRLIKKSGARLHTVKDILIPLPAAALCALSCRFALSFVPFLPLFLRIAVFFAACAALYLGLLFLLGVVQKDDFPRLFRR